MERVEEIKRKLVESRIIPRVLDDFNPRLEIILHYGNKRISIGDEVTLDEVQSHPTGFVHYIDASDVELREIFKNPKLLVLVMTDPGAPGGEYLHWLIMPFISIGHLTAFPPVELVAYEPPRSGAHKLVLTWFKAHEFQPIVPPNSRISFNTRNFANHNALGSPLGASFFTIKYESEDRKHDSSEGSGSSACTSASASA